MQKNHLKNLLEGLKTDLNIPAGDVEALEEAASTAGYLDAAYQDGYTEKEVRKILKLVAR